MRRRHGNSAAFSAACTGLSRCGIHSDPCVRRGTNALRGHLAEYGVVAPQGRARIRQLAGVLELDEKIGGLDRKIWTSARECEETERRRLSGRRVGAARSDPWLAGMLARKPKKVVAVALANRTARRIWALATSKNVYRARAAATKTSENTSSNNPDPSTNADGRPTPSAASSSDYTSEA